MKIAMTRHFFFWLVGTNFFFSGKMPSRSYFPLVVKQFTDLPINCGLFKQKNETSMNFTVLVFLQYFYFPSSLLMHQKVWFSQNILSEIDSILFYRKISKSKSCLSFLFAAKGGATCQLYYQWWIEITNICWILNSNVNYFLKLSIKIVVYFIPVTLKRTVSWIWLAFL